LDSKLRAFMMQISLKYDPLPRPYGQALRCCRPDRDKRQKDCYPGQGDPFGWTGRCAKSQCYP